MNCNSAKKEGASVPFALRLLRLCSKYWQVTKVKYQSIRKDQLVVRMEIGKINITSISMYYKLVRLPESSSSLAAFCYSVILETSKPAIITVLITDTSSFVLESLIYVQGKRNRVECENEVSLVT